MKLFHKRYVRYVMSLPESEQAAYMSRVKVFLYHGESVRSARKMARDCDGDWCAREYSYIRSVGG